MKAVQDRRYSLKFITGGFCPVMNFRLLKRTINNDAIANFLKSMYTKGKGVESGTLTGKGSLLPHINFI